MSNQDAASTHSRRGIELFEKREYDRAISEIDKAIKLNPNSGEAYYGRCVRAGRAARAKAA